MDQPRKERRADNSSSRERRFHGCRRNDQVTLKNEIASLVKDVLHCITRCRLLSNAGEGIVVIQFYVLHFRLEHTELVGGGSEKKGAFLPGRKTRGII